MPSVQTAIPRTRALVSLLLALVVGLLAAAPAGAVTTTVSATSSTSSAAANTGITVISGQSLKISATGTWSCGTSCSTGPNGTGYLATVGQPTLRASGLIGRVGASGKWFDVGSGPTLVEGSGELYLAMNDSNWADNSGSLDVTVTPTTKAVAITAGPTPAADGSLASTGTNVRIAFTGTTGATFECSYNAGSTWSACTSPDVHTYSTGTGAGNFRVKATHGGESVVAIAPLWTVGSGGSGDGNHLYWASYSPGSIGRLDLTGTSLPNPSFVSSPGQPLGVAVNGSHLYWANYATGAVGRSNLDGGSPDPNFIPSSRTGVGPWSLYGLTIDSTYVYWADSSGARIGRALLDGSGVAEQNFISGASNVDDIAVDGNYVYWSSQTTYLGRANLNGTSPDHTFIYTGASSWGIDVDSSYVYWTSFGANAIGRANLNGTSPNSGFITGLSFPLGIAVDGQHIYWANNSGSPSIGKANLNGTSPNSAFAASAANIYGVALDAGYAATVTFPSADGYRFGGDPSFEFSATDAVGFECNIDGSTPIIWTDCSSGNYSVPHSSLAVGTHTFKVRGYDANGSLSSTGVRSFVITEPNKPRVVSGNMTRDTAFSGGSHTDLRGSTADSSNNVYFADVAQSKVVKVTPAGTVSTTSTFAQPADVEIDRSGTLWVVQSSSNSVTLRRHSLSDLVTPTHTYTTSSLNNVTGIGSDPVTGIIYLTGSSWIAQIDPSVASPAITQIVTSGSMPANSRDVAVGHDGTLYVSATDSGAVTKVSLTGTVLGTAISSGARAHLVTSGGVLYAGNGWTGYPAPLNVGMYGTDGRTMATFSTAAIGLNAPLALQPDGLGNLYVAGSGGASITKLKPSTLEYTENGSAIALDDQISLARDASSTALREAVISITNPQAGDVLSSAAVTFGLVKVTISGTSATIKPTDASATSAPLADFQTALRAITYASTSENPSTTGRSLAASITDSAGQTSPTYARPLSVTATNDAPSPGGDRDALDSNGGTAHATPGTPIAVEVSPTLSDPEGSPTAARITSIPSGVTVKRTSDDNTVAVGGDVTLSSGKLKLTVTVPTTADVSIGYAIVDPAVAGAVSTSSNIALDVVPNLSIDSGPPEGSTVTSKSADFTFSGAGAGSHYECKVDPVVATPWTNPCTSPLQLTNLTAGPHTVLIRAVDAEGDSTTITRTWTVANDPPSAGGNREAIDSSTGETAHAKPDTGIAIEVTPTLADLQGATPSHVRIVSIPAGVTLARTDGTAVAAGDDVALSGGKLKLTFTASTPADATIAYTVVDPADNAVVSAASNLLVDVRPVLSFDSGPADGSTSPDANPTFAFSGAGAGGRYDCKVDAGNTGECSSPRQLSNLPWGAHSFAVTAYDVDGDTAARTIGWTVTGSLAAPTIISGPSAETDQRTASFQFQGDPGSVPQCSLDGAEFDWCAQAITYSGLALGPHTFAVRQVDAAGNVSAAATRKWRIDLEFVPGEEGTNVTTVEGLVNDEVAVTGSLLGVGCQLDRGSLQRCEVDAFADVKSPRKARRAALQKIGSGSVTIDERGQSSAVVDVKLNALGRKLMKENPEGLAVVFKVTAMPFDTDQELKSTSKSTMHPPELLIVPSRGMFAGDSTKLGKVGLQYLTAVAKLLNGAKRVRCEGYSDNTVNEKRAVAVSYLRAKAVCDGLEDKGFKGTIGSKGMGSGKPKGDNSTPAGRRRNRRVEIRVWF